MILVQNFYSVADMSLFVHINNKKKDILNFVEWPTQGLDDTTLTEEEKYPINFRQSGKRFVLSLLYNGSNSFLFVNATKVYQFRVRNSEIKDYALCLGNISKQFTINNMKKENKIKRSCKTFFVKGVVKVFSLIFNLIDTNNITDIHKYLMKKTLYKIMFGLIKKIFIRLLTGLVNDANH